MLIQEQENINFTGNLDRDESATIFFIIEEAKETILETKRNCESIAHLFYFNIISV